MDAERRSYEFFQHCANIVDNPKGRAIFEQFAREEQRHLALIRDTYDELRSQSSP
jgi:rubrerythrin